MKFARPHILPVIFLGSYASLLLFLGLDDSVLQLDEGLDSFISSTILKYGFPRHGDGVNYTMDYADVYDGLFVYRTWFPYYLQALSFKIFGLTTFAARLPFAIVGLTSIISLYFFGFRVGACRMVGFVAAFFLASSVPALIYFKCARYIGLPVLFAIFSIWTYLGVFEKKTWRPWGLFIIGSLYFHSMYVEFAGTMTGMAIHSIIYRKHAKKENLKALWISFAFLILTTLPWILYISPVFAKIYQELGGRKIMADKSLLNYFKNMVSFMFQVNNYIFPFILLPALWLKSLKLESFQVNMLFLPTFFVILFSTLNPLPSLHYIVAVFPCLFIPLAIIVVRGLRSKIVFQVLAILFLSYTNIMHVGILRPAALFLNDFYNIEPVPFEYTITGLRELDPKPVLKVSRLDGTFHEKLSPYFKAAFKILEIETRVKSLSYLYGYELTHPYKGTLDGVISFFNSHGTTGETVFIDSEADSLAFYTHMKIIRKQDLKTSDRPDWIVLRTGKINVDSSRKIIYDRYNVGEKLKVILDSHPYEKFEWTGSVARVNNSYDISVHLYKPMEVIGTVKIYRLAKLH